MEQGAALRPVVMFSPSQGAAGAPGAMDLGKALHGIVEELSVAQSHHSKV